MGTHVAFLAEGDGFQTPEDQRGLVQNVFPSSLVSSCSAYDVSSWRWSHTAQVALVGSWLWSKAVSKWFWSKTGQVGTGQPLLLEQNCAL